MLIPSAVAGVHLIRVTTGVAVSGNIGTHSLYVKAAGYSRVGVRESNTTGNWATFNLSTGAVIASSGMTNVGIVSVGNSWFRITATDSTATQRLAIYALDDSYTSGNPDSYSYTGNGTSGIFIWGAQLNIGSTAQPYYSTTPKNLLGFTQEPENAAWTKSNSYVQQNLLTWSQDFDNAAWTKANATVTANVATAPDGSTTADKVIANTTAAVPHGVQQTVSTTGSVVISFYAKAAEYSFAVVTTNANNYVYFDLTNGVVFSTAGTGWSTPTITSVGNGWYRCAAVTSSTNTRYDILVSNVGQANGNTAPLFAGDGTSGIFLWGAQLVQGSTAGDYTQTTSAAAPTRYLNWDGTLTGRKLVEDTTSTIHVIFANTAVAAVPYTLSMYAKAAERNFARLDFVTAAYAAGSTVIANLTTGATTVTSYGATTGTTATAVAVGGGWYRITMTVQATAATYFSQIGLSSTNATIAYLGDGTSGIYVSDFQLSNSASVDPYVYNPQAAAASAAYYGPRFDYDPVTLAAKGLLIEEQRTNLLTYSDGTAAQLNVSSNVTDAGSPISASFTNSISFVDNALLRYAYKTATTVASTAYTVSVYVRMNDDSVPVVGTTTLVGDFGVSFEGVFLTTPSTVTSVGGNVYRISATITAIGVVNGNFGVVKYTAQSAKGFRVTGYQLEAGSFATSYIPTQASQVTRNADSASMLGDNFYTWYNPNEGTLGAESVILPGASQNRAFLISDTTASNNLIAVNANTASGFAGVVNTGGAAQVTFTNSIVAGVTYKIALAYKTDDIGFTVNGAVAQQDSSAVLPSVSRANIGSNGSQTAFGSGHIRRISYYRTRLPNSTLQALTT